MDSDAVAPYSACFVLFHIRITLLFLIKYEKGPVPLARFSAFYMRFLFGAYDLLHLCSGIRVANCWYHCLYVGAEHKLEYGRFFFFKLNVDVEFTFSFALSYACCDS